MHTKKKSVLVIVDDQCPNTKDVQLLKGQTSMYPHLLFIAIASALFGHQGWWSCIRVALLRVGTSSVPVAPPLKRRLAEALQQCLILDATEEDMLTRLEWVDGMGQGSYECWVMPCNIVNMGESIKVRRWPPCSHLQK